MSDAVKPSPSYCVMLYFWRGCRGTLKLLSLGIERVKELAGFLFELHLLLEVHQLMLGNDATSSSKYLPLFASDRVVNHSSWHWVVQSVVPVLRVKPRTDPLLDHNGSKLGTRWKQQQALVWMCDLIGFSKMLRIRWNLACRIRMYRPDAGDRADRLAEMALTHDASLVTISKCSCYLFPYWREQPDSAASLCLCLSKTVTILVEKRLRTMCMLDITYWCIPVFARAKGTNPCNWERGSRKIWQLKRTHQIILGSQGSMDVLDSQVSTRSHYFGI